MRQPHEYASIFPMLPDAELQQLAADIKLNGLNNSITLLDGKILDGRNRYAACNIAGIKPRFEEFQGDDPLAYVFSQNFTRRQLSESQKGMIGARYATLEHGGSRHFKTPVGVLKTVKQSIESAAARVGVGERTIDRAKAVISKGVPELVHAVESGTASLYSASEVAKLPHDEQRAAVAAGPDAIKAAAKQSAQICAPTEELLQPIMPEKKLPRLEINNAAEISIQARVTLDRILTRDKGRVAALQWIIDYCQDRINTNK